WGSGWIERNHKALVRERVGVINDRRLARRVAEAAIRGEAGRKNNLPDLINVAVEKLVEASLEPPAFSTLDKMTSRIRTEVNQRLFDTIDGRLTVGERAGLERLPTVVGPDRACSGKPSPPPKTPPVNPPPIPTWPTPSGPPPPPKPSPGACDPTPPSYWPPPGAPLASPSPADQPLHTRRQGPAVSRPDRRSSPRRFYPYLGRPPLVPLSGRPCSGDMPTFEGNAVAILSAESTMGGVSNVR
ncbi:MAG: hypothetical protein ACRDRW_02025, partial [Pseudonocardiaceae bacterium]